MHETRRLIHLRADQTVAYLVNCIDHLYADPMCSKYGLYDFMKCKLDELRFLNNLLYRMEQQITPVTPPTMSKQMLPQESQNGTQTVPAQRIITLEQLAQYDGKNGNPAYVAVNGIVYDVTDNAGWAAATHFGLSAGRDLSTEFASCHAGQPLLNRLRVVGRLTS